MIAKSQAYMLGKDACEMNTANSYTADPKLMAMIKNNVNNKCALVNDWDRGWKIAAKRMQMKDQ